MFRVMSVALMAADQRRVTINDRPAVGLSAAFHCGDRSPERTFSLLGTVLRCLMSFDIGRRRLEPPSKTVLSERETDKIPPGHNPPNVCLHRGDFVLQHFRGDSVLGRFCPGGILSRGNYVLDSSEQNITPHSGQCSLQSVFISAFLETCSHRYILV